MSRKAAEMARRRSILFAALANGLGKLVDRSHLVAGGSDRITATIVGKVNRATVDATITGDLNVGHPTTTNKSSAAPVASVVACLLAELPDDAARVRATEKIAKQFVGGKLPEQPKAIAELAKAFCKRLTASTTGTKAGAVSFSIADV